LNFQVWRLCRVLNLYFVVAMSKPHGMNCCSFQHFLALLSPTFWLVVPYTLPLFITRLSNTKGCPHPWDPCMVYMLTFGVYWW
jgi:hypothetical protein